MSRATCGRRTKGVSGILQPVADFDDVLNYADVCECETCGGEGGSCPEPACHRGYVSGWGADGQAIPCDPLQQIRVDLFLNKGAVRCLTTK